MPHVCARGLRFRRSLRREVGGVSTFVGYDCDEDEMHQFGRLMFVGYTEECARLFPAVDGSPPYAELKRQAAKWVAILVLRGEVDVDGRRFRPSGRCYGDHRRQSEIDSRRKYGGSVSAEHGVGMTKKPYLQYSRSETEIDYLREVKKVFDPNNIMNRGKIFDM